MNVMHVSLFGNSSHFHCAQVKKGAPDGLQTKNLIRLNLNLRWLSRVHCFFVPETMMSKVHFRQLRDSVSQNKSQRRLHFIQLFWKLKIFQINNFSSPKAVHFRINSHRSIEIDTKPSNRKLTLIHLLNCSENLLPVRPFKRSLHRIVCMFV